MQQMFSLRTYAVVLCALFGGCASYGPAVERFQRTTIEPNSAIATWSDLTWANAAAGHLPSVLGLLARPPEGTDGNTAALAARFARLKESAAERRAADASETMKELADLEPVSNAWLESIAELADLWATGLDPEALEARAEALVRSALESTRLAAVAAETEMDFESAARAWAAAAYLAQTLDEFGTWRSAIAAQRAAGEHVGWQMDEAGIRLLMRVDLFDAEACVDVIETIVEQHVNRLDWLAISLSGFSRMRLRAELAPLDNESLLRTIAEAEAALREQGGEVRCPARSLCSKARRILRKAITQVLNSNLTGPTLQYDALPRAFVEGAFHLTDQRSRMIWTDEVGGVRRGLGGKYVGIGCQVGLSADGSQTLSPMAGSPARKAGIEKGDRLVAVDGWSTKGNSIGAGVDRVLGLAGTRVVLSIEREGIDGTFDVSVTRESIVRPAILGWRQIGLDQEGSPRWEWLVNADLGIAYIKLSTFTSDTEPEFRRAMNAARAALPKGRQVEGLILDLRENSGGSKSSATRLIDLFLDHGALCATQTSDGTLQVEPASRGATRLAGMPVVILINERSASAAELLSGALQGAGEAILLGERSFGKGSAQMIFAFRTCLMKVTSAWFAVPTATGTRFIDRSRAPESWGITPNLLVRGANPHDSAMRDVRGRWYSYVGHDQPEEDGATASIIDSDDRAAMLALAVLEARVLAATTQ